MTNLTDEGLLHEFEFGGFICLKCNKTFQQLTALNESVICDGGWTV